LSGGRRCPGAAGLPAGAAEAEHGGTIIHRAEADYLDDGP
jgi:hypothetical protein